jgi:N-acylneuraminate cytidylyltransferase
MQTLVALVAADDASVRPLRGHPLVAWAAAPYPIRSVDRCREHPAKMWRIEGELLRPLLEGAGCETPWHSLPYQRLPDIGVETSTLEIVWRRVIGAGPSGVRVTPFVVEGIEAAFAIECSRDLDCAKRLVERGKAELPPILELAR